MTIEDIYKYASLDTREIKAFGGTIKIRNLSIKEMKTITKMPEEDALLYMVSNIIVEPKMTIKQLEELGISALPDITNIVNAVNGK